MAGIDINRVKVNADHSIDIAYYPGSHADSEYLIGLLEQIKGAEVGKPEKGETLTHVTLRGSGSEPITKAQVMETLRRDPGLDLTTLKAED